MPSLLNEPNWYALAVTFWQRNEVYLTAYLQRHQDSVKRLLDQEGESAASALWTDLRITLDDPLKRFYQQNRVALAASLFYAGLSPALARVLTLYLMYWRRSGCQVASKPEFWAFLLPTA